MEYYIIKHSAVKDFNEYKERILLNAKYCSKMLRASPMR